LPGSSLVMKSTPTRGSARSDPSPALSARIAAAALVGRVAVRVDEQAAVPVLRHDDHALRALDGDTLHRLGGGGAGEQRGRNDGSSETGFHATGVLSACGAGSIGIRTHVGAVYGRGRNRTASGYGPKPTRLLPHSAQRGRRKRLPNRR
jgi:hypothetical protein